MKRRDFLVGTTAALAAPLATPHLAKAADQRVLKFIPQSDLAVLDPIWTTAYVTRNHGFMVFDTLYGQDSDYKAQPQMAEGAVTEDGGKTWRLTLRDGLKFHDNTPVLARDCVASLNRWGKRDAFGQALFARADEVSAPDDKTILFRMKQPFVLLLDALAKCGSNIPVIMPERLANTSPFTQVTEMVGSGPFRFVTNERVAGSLVVYERNPLYQPRANGTPSGTAGPKHAYFDRVEWHVVPDAATAAGAMQSREMDWWEQPSADLMPLLTADRGLTTQILDRTGNMGIMRPNYLFPPFNNPAICRALLGAIDQKDFMIAVNGENPAGWHVPVGVYPPQSPMATDVGMSVLTGPRDLDKVKRDLIAAGYKGERVALMAATDFPILTPLANVAADMLRKVGMNVDFQATDWGTVVQRRASKSPPDQGGWNLFFTYLTGQDEFNPAVDVSLRGNGADGWFGWPTMPKLDQLRSAWVNAPDVAAQKKIAADVQQLVFDNPPFFRLGQMFQPTVYRNTLSGMLTGLPIFWNLKRA